MKDLFLTDIDYTATDTEASVKAKAIYKLNLNFFGVNTCINVNSEIELNQWKYFFKYFISDEIPFSASISIWFDVDGTTDSFIESLFKKDYSIKSTYIEFDNKFMLWSKFNIWSKKETPIPPFNFPPLNNELVIINASSVLVQPKNKGVLFIAPPYQGKSTLVNYFIAEGGIPVADNYTIIRATDSKLLPYLTPTGIREETIRLNAKLNDIVANVPKERITISEVTGKVYLLHFDEIHKFSNPIPSDISRIIYLENRYKEFPNKYSLTQLRDQQSLEILNNFQIDNGISKKKSSQLYNKLIHDAKTYHLVYDLNNCNLQEIYMALLNAIIK